MIGIKKIVTYEINVSDWVLNGSDKSVNVMYTGKDETYTVNIRNLPLSQAHQLHSMLGLLISSIEGEVPS